MKNLLLVLCLALALGCGGSEGEDPRDDECDNLGNVAIPAIAGIYPEEYLNDGSDHWRCASETLVSFDMELGPQGDLAITLDVPGNSPYGMCYPDQVGKNMTFDGIWFVVRDGGRDLLYTFLGEISELTNIFEILNFSPNAFSAEDGAGGNVACSRQGS